MPSTFALIAAGAAAYAAEASAEIEGAWRIVSVEFAGRAVPGLEGARLVLAGGKKTFSPLGGTVEEGTYAIDPSARPRRIDSTTGGKGRTEKGIYEVDGDVLRLCISQEGRERPAGFATRPGTDLILLVLRREGAPPPPAPGPPPSPPLGRSEPETGRAPAAPPAGPRRFRMGFTGFVPDISLEAVTAARKFVRENGDIVAHHLEGAPWAECLQGLPFPAPLLEEWEGKRSSVPPGGKVYLAISPGRGDLKVLDKARPLPRELAGKAYDDPLVKEVYLRYCRRAIEFFRPDWLAIGVEVNEIFSSGPVKWKAYAELHRHVHAAIKRERKDLPVFASFSLHNLFKAKGSMLAAFEDLMPCNDVIGASYYPFFVPAADRRSALDWMLATFDRYRKPYAVAETNDEAERLPLPRAGVVIEGTPARQLAYYERLLALAQERRFAFVISFVHQDYDRLWEKIKDVSPELFIAWRDCGLIDEGGRPRPAYAVWKGYLALPLEEAGPPGK